MTAAVQNLSHWQPVPVPAAIPLPGRWVTLEPLSATRHTASLWQAVNGHDHIWTWLGDGPYAVQADLATALAAKESGAAARFYAILPTSSGVTEGYASLMRIDPANGVIEVGNVLFAPSLQRTSAATETIYLLARYIFEDLGYRRFEWKCNALNQPSRQAALRLGFTYEGIFRQHMVIKGQNRDTAWYAMLDSEWPARKRAFEAWLAPENFDSSGKQIRTLASFAAEITR
jgi:RimJ/RimL family protein N-acetyltransferase